jgi:hypothetical protein
LLSFWYRPRENGLIISCCSGKLKLGCFGSDFYREVVLAVGSTLDVHWAVTIVGSVISKNDGLLKGASKPVSVPNRRYAIRFPFAADVELIDLESGTQASGVTSDISLGGCFVCTSKPLALKARARVVLKRKDQSVQALAVVRIVKPRVGMGLEFIDIEIASRDVLDGWIEQLKKKP